MKKDSVPLFLVIGMLIIGIFLGNIFTFGMQFWNSDVERESCTLIETQFLSYEEIRQPKRVTEIKEIAIDCSNGQRYFIDGVSINSEITTALYKLHKQENIALLIHPNSNTIVELTTESDTLLKFNETIKKLGGEATEFLFLGIFMYFCSLVGLYHTVWNWIKKKGARR